MSKRVSDVVLTLLLLNLFLAAILRGAPLPVYGMLVPTLPLPWSALLLAGWLGARALGRRTAPGAIDPMARVGGWLSAHRLDVTVGALFVAGLVIRFWGIDFGAPLVVHPDEHVVITKTLIMLKSGSLAAPEPYQYPTFFYYLLLPAFALRYVRGKSEGLWSDLGEIDADTFEFYLVARSVSAVFGALTIVLAYVVGRRMWPGAHGRYAGAIAAGFLTFAFNHVKESHHGVTDATLTFLTLLAFLALVTAAQRASVRTFVVAGFVAGLACATKYSALPLVFGLAAAPWLATSSEGPRRPWRWLAAGLAAVPVGFFTGYPYALFNWPPFLEHLGWMSSAAGSRTYDAGARLAYIARYSAESGLGIVVALLVAAGIVAAVHRRRAEGLLAVVVIAATLMLMARTSFPFFPRYLLPITPLALLLASDLVVRASGWIASRAGRRWAVAVPAAVLVLAVAPQAREAVQFVRYLSAPDTRAIARAWIVEHLPPGTIVATEEPYFRLPRAYDLRHHSPLHELPADDYLAHDVTALVFTDLRDPPAGGPEADDRRRLQRAYPLAIAIRPGDAGAVGPTVYIHVARPR